MKIGKRAFGVVALLLFFVTQSILSQSVGPKITSTEKEFDFGKIVEGSIVVHDFSIKNTGDEELYLIKVSSSCGCTVAKPKKEKLQPGESTILKATFNSRGKHGRQKKYINVFNNDKGNTRFRLVILANVVSKEDVNSPNELTPRIALSENQHNFGTVIEGDVLTLNISIKSVGDSELKITDIQTSCGCTAALLDKENLKPNEKSNLRIELDTSGMKGKKSRTVTIRSNDPVNPRMIITLFVNVENKE